MKAKKNSFLFYTDWDNSMIGSAPALAGTLAAFATEFGLSGNVWQQWLTYILMMHDNAFTMACERREVMPDSTLVKLAERDLGIFMELFRTEEADFDEDEGLLPMMLDYKAPYEDECTTDAGRRIKELSCRLAAAEDSKEFTRTLMDHYEKHGAGMYGLYKAFRVDPSSGSTAELKLIPVADSADVSFDDLVGYEIQKQKLRENTEAFLAGRRANNCLLFGDAGTGKSSSIKGILNEYYGQGQIKNRNYRFIIYMDDLSFEEFETEYKYLKAVIEGGLEKKPENVLIYATSNRRHLIRENYSDKEGDIRSDMHTSDTVQEKLSLAYRFGVTIYFGAPVRKEFQEILRVLAERNGVEMPPEQLYLEANAWELSHGGRSGRTAQQFIDHLLGKDPEDKNDEVTH